MASRMALFITAAMAVVVVVVEGAEQSSYRVGDADGWAVGVDYDKWAHGKTFRVGDTLEFAYKRKDSHNVVVVDAHSYAACTVPSNARTLTSGKDDVKLDHAGKWFFICGVKAHCKSGMKLAITVKKPVKK